MKKVLLFIVVIIAICGITVCAENEFKDLDEKYDDSYLGTPTEIVDKILSGQLNLDGKSIIDNLANVIFSTVKGDIPIIISLFASSIALSLAQNTRFIGNTGQIALLGGKIIAGTLIITPSISLIKKIGALLKSVSNFTTAVMPPITLLLASCGATSSVGILTPSSTLISTVLIGIIQTVVFPLLISGLAVSVCAGCVQQLNGIKNILKNVSSWLLGILFTLFSGIITLQGITSAVSDGISLKGVKYAISSSVPIIGGTVSESASMIVNSAYYIKNAGGIMGIIFIFGMCVAPLLEIVCFYFLLKIISNVITVYSENNIEKIIGDCGEFIKLCGIALLEVVIIWVVFLGMIICAGGAI